MTEQKSEQVIDEQKSVGLNIRLAPVNNSDQPVLANFTRLNGAPGMVFVDFGFLEPAALSALSRLAQAGGKIPENLNGKLAVRVALGYDTLAALHQQLGQVIDSRSCNIMAAGPVGANVRQIDVTIRIAEAFQSARTQSGSSCAERAQHK